MAVDVANALPTWALLASVDVGLLVLGTLLLTVRDAAVRWWGATRQRRGELG